MGIFRLIGVVALASLLYATGKPVAAQESTWTEVKCERYRKAWTDALARRGAQGLGSDFMTKHDAFLASGCVARADVCPRSREELAIANILTIAAMNAGASSTFLPFACRP